MTALLRDEVVNCTNPKLDVFLQTSGNPVNVYSLEWRIVNASDVQVYPPSGRAVANIGVDCPTGDRIATGHYVARYTVPDLEAAELHRIDWYFKLFATSPEQKFSEEFDVHATPPGTTGEIYASVDDMRAEGVTVAQASDAQLTAILTRSSRFIDQCCARWFTARSCVLALDGSGTPTIFVDVPIVSVSGITEDGSLVEATEYVVYNRHMGGLLRPDDRNNPKIEFVASPYPSSYTKPRRWAKGSQNLRVSGVFGYTEPDGTTPTLIRRACVLLTFRDVSLLSSPDDRFAARERHRLTEERTRDQSYQLGPGRSDAMVQGRGATPWTGDAEIDSILDLYRSSLIVRCV